MNLDTLFNPRSIAIVGASRNPKKIGYTILKNIIVSGYKGKIYPVNPNADNILDLRVYPDISSINDDIDTVVISVPRHLVVDVAEEAGQNGVKHLVVIASGFKEVGGEGVRLEEKLESIAKKYDMGLVGPNSLGIIDTHTPINITFAHLMPRRGNLAFISQSGAMITSILDWAASTYIGFSKIVSIGNKAVLDEIDFIEYLKDDRNTKAILLYVESIDEGRRFVTRAGEITRKKPIIVLKSGITEAGAKAAVSHTGAMAGRITAYVAGFKKAGVILASNISQLFDYAVALATQPPPRRDSIAVVSNSGGLCILAADSLIQNGLSLANLDSSTINTLRGILPPTAAIYNPIDVIGDSDVIRYLSTLENILKDENVDLVLAMLAPSALIDPIEVAKGIVDMREKYRDKGILACFVGGQIYEEASEYLMENGVPYYSLPERAVSAIVGLVMYREYIERPSYKYVEIKDVDRDMASLILERVRKDGRHVLLENEAKQLAHAYGIPVPRFYLAKSPLDAVMAADHIGYPVILKVVSPDILHKTDVGGIRANLHSSGEVEEAYEDIINSVMRYAPKARIYGILVEKMAEEGIETIIGVTKDIQFGHIIMFGAGGIYTELLKDVSFALIPISREEAHDLMAGTRIYNLLRGFRGMPAKDVNILYDVLLRINQLILDFPEIVELDINPIRIYEAGKGALALDIKIILSRG